IDFNSRTSMHVHVNALDMTVDQINLFLSTYLILEDVFFHHVGESRIDNNYCTRLVGDDYILGALQALHLSSAESMHDLLLDERTDRQPRVTIHKGGHPKRRLSLSKY